MDWAEDLKQTFKKVSILSYEKKVFKKYVTFVKTVKKGRRAAETVTGNVSSDSPSTPDYDSNFQENALSDEFSSGLDLKSVPAKNKHRSGWTDEPVRSGSSGKLVE